MDSPTRSNGHLREPSEVNTNITQGLFPLATRALL